MPDEDRSEAEPPERGPPRLLRRGVRALLRVPLAHKILIANAVIVAAAVAGAVLVVRTYPGIRTLPALALIGSSAALALVVATAVNAAIVRLALRPLRELENTALQVEAGDMEARASVPAVADRRLRRLAGVFNDMLTHMAAERERRRRLAVEALRGEGRVRRRLAAALHDDTAQRLAAHVLRLKEIESAATLAEKDRLVEEVRRETVETLQSVRRTARGLRPPELGDLGVVPALRAHVRRHWGDAECRIDLEGTDVSEPMPDEHRRTLYRLLREALSNALRHADADRVRVRVTREDGRILAEVVDDGCGFHLAARSGVPPGLGLVIIRVLARDLDGRVEIDSTPGEGTRVRARIPLPEDASADALHSGSEAR